MAPKFSATFYAIRNAASTAARNALIRSAARKGMSRADLASAAQVSPSTVGKIITAA